MGIDEIRGQLQASIRQDADGLIEVLATVTPDLTEESRHDLVSAIQRTLMTLALDPNATENDVRRQLTAVIRGFITIDAAAPA